MPKDDGLLELLDNSTEFEVLSFYNGEVTLHFDKKLHAYFRQTDEGRVLVPGATTITDMVDKSAPLMQWAANETCNYVLAQWPSTVGEVSLMVQYYALMKDKQQTTRDPASMCLMVHPYDMAETLVKARLHHRAVSKEATDVGNDAHNWLENFTKFIIALGPGRSSDQYTVELYAREHPLPGNPGDPAYRSVSSAINWMNRHRFCPLRSEWKVFSREYNYAGTPDWLAYVIGCDDPTCCQWPGVRMLTLGDYKTSKELHDEYRMQLASYNQAYTEEAQFIAPNTTRIDMHCILRLGKADGAFEAKWLLPDEFESDLDGFLGALQTYNWFKRLDLIKRGEKGKAKALKAAQKKPSKRGRNKVIIPTDEVSLVPVVM